MADAGRRRRVAVRQGRHQADRAGRGYTDTGVTLITDKPIAGSGLDAKDTAFGLQNCWG